MRSPTDNDPLRPAAGYGRFVGRVGALALFLGVGTAIAMPAAHADTDSASPSRTSVSAVSDSAHASPARASRKSRPSASVRTVGSPVRSDSASARGGQQVDTRVLRQFRAGAVSASSTPALAVATSPQISNQVSPLGNPQQIARERVAMQSVKSLPVALMKVVLRIGFLAAAREQFALVGGPDETNLKLLNNAVDEYALASAFSEQVLNPMDPVVVTQVAPPHSWYGLDVGGSRLLYDNPDTIYRFVPVNKTAEYVLTGRIYAGIPADTTFSVLEGTSGKTSSILTLADLDISADGTFVITVSGDPAAPGQTNHLQLTSESTLIAARNTLGDWNTEDPMELEVQKVSGPRNSLFAQLGGFVFFGRLVNDHPFLASLASLIPPLAIADSSLVRGPLTALLMLVRGANQEAKYMALATTDSATGQLRQPNVMTQPASNAEFLANQLQSNGYFQLANNEALVLTIDPGNAEYFTVPVYNDWTITGDYWNQQTSLNNYQAVPNGDGTYTMVVSVADPGVKNWVSTGGLNQGLISMRFQNLDPNSPDVPSVQSAVVELADLRGYLPPGTVFVTPVQRTAQLDARLAGFNKRWAPYVQS